MKKLWFICFLIPCLAFAGEPFGQALEKAREKKWNEAINLFHQHLETHPKDANAYYNLGLCQENSGDFLGARYSFERAYKMDPKLDKSVEHIKSCMEQMKLKEVWEPPFSWSRITVLKISSFWWRIGLWSSSLLAAMGIFWGMTRNFRGTPAFLTVLATLAFAWFLYLSYLKEQSLSKNSHAILNTEVQSVFLGKEGNARVDQEMNRGERVKLLEEGVRCQVMRGNATYWLEREKLLLF
ncbi:MAG: tetratricopeptide repeat protein [Bacteroidetes bacterium]|nr:MAG: tetratricopeptide repeat protein [Bacteroidota bacterium]